MHLLLIVRDWYAYGFSVDLIARKRASLRKKGITPTAEEVCDAVIDSSFRPNQGVTDISESLHAVSLGYAAEVFFLYAVVVATLLAAAYFWIRVCRCMASSGKKDD
jgi:hypothetical protein